MKTIAQQIAELYDDVFDRAEVAKAVIGQQHYTITRFSFPDNSTIAIDDMGQVAFIGDKNDNLIGGLYPPLPTQAAPAKDYTDQWTEPEQWAEPDIDPPGTQSRNNTPQF